MAPTLWLVRHAPTRDNLDGVVMGQRDPAPTSYGLSAAADLAGAVDVRAGRVLGRAARARRPPARSRRTLRCASTSACASGRFGEWEGRDKRELRAAHPAAFTAAGAIRLDADSAGQRAARRAAGARRTRALSDLDDVDGPVLVVAHNGSLRAALVLLGEADLATATTMSLDYLSPVVADLRHAARNPTRSHDDTGVMLTS